MLVALRTERALRSTGHEQLDMVSSFGLVADLDYVVYGIERIEGRENYFVCDDMFRWLLPASSQLFSMIEPEWPSSWTERQGVDDDERMVIGPSELQNDPWFLEELSEDYGPASQTFLSWRRIFADYAPHEGLALVSELTAHLRTSTNATLALTFDDLAYAWRRGWLESRSSIELSAYVVNLQGDRRIDDLMSLWPNDEALASEMLSNSPSDLRAAGGHRRAWVTAVSGVPSML